MTGLAPLAPAPAPATNDFFYLVINGVSEQSVVPMPSSNFDFDGQSNWRLELPGSILEQATKSKSTPLGICLYLSPVRTGMTQAC
mmetsp:Transcript_28848/g.64508  ORF Transcript_28848/g.64508 Transcript_28848/m.64508 type:complete len:85 (-) Transcript_28848:39-293(-)